MINLFRNGKILKEDVGAVFNRDYQGIVSTYDHPLETLINNPRIN
jgi:hypothetical protein